MNAIMKPTQNIDYTKYKDGESIAIPLGNIDPLPEGNVRKDRNPKDFAALRAAIVSANGVTQSVTVRANPDDPNRVQLIAGYGRFEVFKLEGFETIPAVIKVASDKEAIAMAISENLDREDLSIADEILAAQRFISHYDGNYEEAAKQLNWSVNRLRGRLLLNNCTEAVLTALRQGDIVLGHAEILSAFVPKLQDGTLVKIIDEQWTVEYLKERAGKANRWLKNAIFDKSDCASCQHNSDFQAELFDNSVGKAKCSNLTCFKSKTDEFLATRKAELEEEHGVVLLAIEKPASDRTTVSEELVGKDQFCNGCTGCTNKVVILQDGINKDAGSVIHDQCIDSDCLRAMKSAFDESNKLQEDAQDGDGSGTTPNAKPSKTVRKSKKPAKQSTPSAVVEQNKVSLRSVAASFLEPDLHLLEAITTATLIDRGGIHTLGEAVGKSLGISLPTPFNERVVALQSLSPDALAEAKLACYSAYLAKGVSNSGDDRALVINCLTRAKGGKEEAVRLWVPTEKRLKNYLKGALVTIGTQSGFSEFYDNLNGESAFQKVAKKSKGELIKALLTKGFDWSEYAPDDYQALLV